MKIINLSGAIGYFDYNNDTHSLIRYKIATNKCKSGSPVIYHSSDDTENTLDNIFGESKNEEEDDDILTIYGIHTGGESDRQLNFGTNINSEILTWIYTTTGVDLNIYKVTPKISMNEQRYNKMILNLLELIDLRGYGYNGKGCKPFESVRSVQEYLSKKKNYFTNEKLQLSVTNLRDSIAELDQMRSDDMKKIYWIY